jgi:hypothetical protein
MRSLPVTALFAVFNALAFAFMLYGGWSRIVDSQFNALSNVSLMANALTLCFATAFLLIFIYAVGLRSRRVWTFAVLFNALCMLLSLFWLVHEVFVSSESWNSGRGLGLSIYAVFGIECSLNLVYMLLYQRRPGSFIGFSEVGKGRWG